MRAEQDLLAAVPCRHCAQMLYGRVRFCPYCGAEEEVGTPADDAAGASFQAGLASFDRAEPPPAPSATTKPVDMPKPAEKERAPLPDTLGAFSESRDDLDFKIARIVPAAFERIEELPSTITTPARTPEQDRGAKLKYLATGAALALCAFVLVLGYLRFGGPNEPDSAPAPTAKVSKAPGVGEADRPAPGSASAPSHAGAPPATTTQTVVPPTPETRAGDKDCNEALAALALCRKEEAR